jgi:CBS domain-containing protein
VTVSQATPIRDAAALMGKEGISSLVILDASARPVGILTDRDLRNRVVATGLDPKTPVERVMSRPLITVDASRSLLEALEAIIRHRIHHLVVMDGERLLGVFTDTDLLRLEAAHPAFLIREMDHQTTIEGVAQVQRTTPQMVGALESQGLPATRIARIIAEVNDRLVMHLLKLAERELGPPPVPYCWLALGSEGRREQALRTDQDNALVFADPPGDPEVVSTYFARLSEWVGKGLDAAGFPPCPGGVVAREPSWRRSLSAWLQVIDGWVELPEPEQLLSLGELLDLRGVAGDLSLADRMVERIHERVKVSRGLLTILAKDTLRNHPPIGIFGRLVVARSGERAHALDLKCQGTALVVEAARVLAVDVESRATNTVERLVDAQEKGRIDAALLEEIREGYEFLMTLRLTHQLKAIGLGRPPENWVNPRDLTPRERHHLKDTFRAVRGLQQILAAMYRIDR